MRTAAKIFGVLFVLSAIIHGWDYVGRRFLHAGPISPNEVIFDITAIANRTPGEVIAILGEPDSIEDTVNAGRVFKKYFWNPKTPVWDGDSGFKQHSIVFVDGKADWIAISGTGGLMYHKNKSLRAINLPPGPSPTTISRMGERWEDGDYPGYRYLSIFKDSQGRLKGFLVHVNTVPLS